MAATLRSRLARIREASSRPRVAERSDQAPGPAQDRGEGRGPPPGSWREAGGGLWHRLCEPSGVACPERAGLPLGVFSRRLAGLEASAYRTLFFDLETTGLSGGAGTVAFLAALGRYREDGVFVVNQYFMDDFPAEPALLECIEAELSGAEAVVTYNGASFDLPLYAVRRAMHGLSLPARPPHADAVHAARRLYRGRLPDCSLGSLEAELLGLVRVGDIPGAQVPEAWFEYLRSGKSDRLSLVFEHNARDVASLAGLAWAMVGAASGELRLPVSDPVGLAELQSRLDPALAEATLKACLGSADGRAARSLARLYGKAGRRDERLGLAPFLPNDAAGLYAKSLHAERQRGDLGEALRYAERASEAYRASGGPGARGLSASRIAMAERAERKAERLRRALASSTGREGDDDSSTERP